MPAFLRRLFPQPGDVVAVVRNAAAAPVEVRRHSSSPAAMDHDWHCTGCGDQSPKTSRPIAIEQAQQHALACHYEQIT